MQLFEIRINSRNVLADRLLAVRCDYEAPAGHFWHLGTWSDPAAVCAAFDRVAGDALTESFDDDETQPGGEAPADLQPRGGAA